MTNHPTPPPKAPQNQTSPASGLFVVFIPAVMKHVRVRGAVRQVAQWLNANDRTHWSKRVKLTRQYRQLTAAIARQHRLPQGLDSATVDVFVFKTRAGRYDPANLHPTVKACVDGLVDYGLLPDDDHTHLDGPHLHHGGPGEPGLKIVIKTNTQTPQNLVTDGMLGEPHQPGGNQAECEAFSSKGEQ